MKVWGTLGAARGDGPPAREPWRHGLQRRHQRLRQRPPLFLFLYLSLFLSLSIYVYIYIYTHIIQHNMLWYDIVESAYDLQRRHQRLRQRRRGSERGRFWAKPRMIVFAYFGALFSPATPPSEPAAEAAPWSRRCSSLALIRKWLVFVPAVKTLNYHSN